MYRNSDLLFVPLGGSGEIGMNANLYHYDGSWLMVDLGISFPDDSMPGIDVILPDLSFIEVRADSLAGLVLTHCLLYTSPSPRDQRGSRMPSSA